MSKAFIQKISLPFNPISITGCQLWLDGADAATVTGTSSVTAWTDKSGKGNNPTFSGTNPSYNSVTKVITTANANQQFTVPAASIQQSAGSGSLFLVYGDQQTGGGNSSGYNALWGTAGPGERFYQTLQAPTNSYAINGAFSPSGTVSAALATTNTLLYNMNYTYNSTTGDLRINGTTLSSSYQGTPVPSGALTLSGTGWGVVANVRLYEVISYKGATLLTTPQIQQIEGYLAQKWGLTANLPPGHPGLTQTIYTSNYNAKNPGIATAPQSIMTYNPYFAPITFTGCQLWLDGADTSTVTGTTTVTQWRDKSGNAYNGTVVNASVGSPVAPSYLTNSINGLPAITMSGTSYFTGSTNVNSTTLTAFFLGNCVFGTGGSSQQRILGLGVTGLDDYSSTLRPIPLSVISGGTQLLAYRNANMASATVVSGTNFIGCCLFDGTTNFMYKDGTLGTQTASSGTFTTSIYGVGSDAGTQFMGGTSSLGTNCLVGKIGELIVYNTALNTSQRQQVEGYLAWKWGLTGSLPANHPFKSVPPGRPSQVAGIPVQVKMTAIRVVQLQYSGTYTTAGNFFATFTGNGSVTVLSPVTINYFAIGGGGGGGAGPGGGGGAGGLQMGSMSLSVGTYNIVIGPGGPAHTNGSNTTFGTTLVVALGGGFGANGYPSTETGGSGGCGGGRGSGLAGAPGTGSQGYNGGSMGGIGSGGGGGVGGVGETSPTTSNTGGAGGIGVLYYGTYYGGGGGGAPNHGGGTGFAGAGGLGGGGRGGQNGAPILDPVAGTPNTGGGGGGGRSANQFSGPGAAGGSGVFIISY
jgi:hypothetical protein